MKRTGNLYQRIPDYENLCLAFWKAAKGKQNRHEVIDFRKNFTANIQKLREQFISHNIDIGHYHFFTVFDPKQRSICAASFPERILHHAIMNICEPVLENYAVYDSYACRKEKGNRKALARSQKFARYHGWYLKLDIRKYFDSIDHDIMMKQLSRKIKDKAMLRIFRQLLKTYHTQPGKGMPIGNLISQHLANFYLTSFDRWIKETRNVRAYLRYMDDFVLFGHTRAYLKAELEYIRQYLIQNLALTLKDNVQLNKSMYGIPFLGYQVFPNYIKLSSRSRKRFIQKFIKYERKWLTGKWTVDKLVRHMEPLIEFTRAADTAELRKSVIKQFGVSS